MPDQDPFKTTETQTVVTPQDGPSDPFADQLKGITNDQGEPKYKDTETALEALKASQQFIKQLQTEKAQREKELADAREQVTKMGSIEDFVQRVSPNSQEPTPPQETPPAPKGLGEDDVAAIIEDRIKNERVNAQKQSNLQSVIEQLTSVHGDKTANFIAEKAQSMGTTPEDLRKLAMDNPSLAMAALGGQAKAEPSPSTSSIQTTRTNSDDDNPAPTFERSITRGGFTNAELAERWKEVGNYTYKRLNVETV